ncbi:CASP-like protein 1E2 [Andrographis paniculata]|uniref:CASP-like protein 1E2 n=1 Tax=Andrographis paniculata TaxID=175694 RepID=UPI0021E6E214|nr:CASP-like protein 1E2 [Andrographis paniculata]
MEAEYKESGMESGSGKAVAVANKRKMRGWDVILRFFALALSLAAAVVLAVDKETVVVQVPVAAALPPLSVPVAAKTSYLSAFVFFVIANSIACAHAGVSLILALAYQGENKAIALTVLIADLMMVALLFSGIGAGVAIGVLGYNGNSHTMWGKVCDKFDKFCHQAAAAFGISGAAALLFLLLVVLATLNLHKKH